MMLRAVPPALLLTALTACASMGAPPDPDSLAADALFARHGSESALRLISQATGLAPERPDLAWLHARICSATAGCDPEPLDARVRELDPQNGAGWLGPLSRARKLDEVGKQEQFLAAIAATERVDFYWTTLLHDLTRAAAHDRTEGLATTLATVNGWLAAVLFPPLQPLGRLCMGDELHVQARLEQCRAAASALQRGDTILAQMYGASLARRAWPPGSAEGNLAIAMQRLGHYRLSQLQQLDTTIMTDDAAAARFMEALSQHRTEQELIRAQLNDAGLTPDPPSDWVDRTPI